ncbi:hypothetical protein ACRAWC_22875 [Leifsonia sp. L25]|uniref:hypothetical protein n=1 Tax=Leifsonia sp. L25 TaxID=3423957 RepID=UPI003D6866A6
MEVLLTKSTPQTQYLPGDSVPWTLAPQVSAGGPGQTVRQLTVTDTLPASLELDVPCTRRRCPRG